MKNKIRTFYLLFANTTILLALIIISSYAFLYFYYSGTQYYKLNNLQKLAYGQTSNEEIKSIIEYTWDTDVIRWDYEEITGFRESPRKSSYVNVNNFGVRQNTQITPNNFDPNGKVWVFGGSTTWGYGVADSQTIPSHLEKILKKKVVNFGRGYYYSLQENLLLSILLKTGYKPSEIIFIDGINERCGIEVYEKEFNSLFLKAQNASHRYQIKNIFEPTIVITNKIINKFISQKPEDLHKLDCERYGKKSTLSETIKSNLEDRKALCKRFGVRCTTFVQPFAGIDIQGNGLLGESELQQLRLKKVALSPVWQEMNAIFVDSPLPNDNMTYLVDSVHYSDKANSIIAKRIASYLR